MSLQNNSSMSMEDLFYMASETIEEEVTEYLELKFGVKSVKDLTPAQKEEFDKTDMYEISTYILENTTQGETE